MVRFRISLLAFACGVVLAACVGGADCAALTSDIELTLTAEALSPSSIAVCRDDDVTLTVDSDVTGVLHIHGYDAELPATNVTEDEVLELRFSAGRSGQFPIELHTDDNTQGINVGLLTVHEP